MSSVRVENATKDYPTSGRVLIDDQDVGTLGDDALSDLRAARALVTDPVIVLADGRLEG